MNIIHDRHVLAYPYDGWRHEHALLLELGRRALWGLLAENPDA